MIEVSEHNHSKHSLTFEDLYLLQVYGCAEEFHRKLTPSGYGLPKEDVDWWVNTCITIRWSDIHADSINVWFCVILDVCNFKHPSLASKIVTQYMSSIWSLKKLAIFLLCHRNEFDAFVTEAFEKNYPWNYIKRIVDDYALIHCEYSYSLSITTLCELTHYDPHTVISNDGELQAICDKVLAENEKGVADYKKGKLGALNHLKGQVMKFSKGKADMTAVAKMLEEKLKS